MPRTFIDVFSLTIRQFSPKLFLVNSKMPNTLIRLCLLSFTLISSNLFAETLSIRSDVWYPINGNPDDANPGYMIELAKEILTPKGITVDYQITPWARALLSVRTGLSDCTVGAYKTEVPDFIFPDLEWGIDQNLFYVEKSNPWRFTGLDSFSKTRIGLISEYSYTDEIDQFAKETKNKAIFDYTFSDNALEQNITKVLAGRLTATIESQLVMPEKLKELGLEGQLIPAGNSGQTIPMYIACSPNKASSLTYVKWFDEGITRLRKTGRLREILAKYALNDWVE